MKVSDYVIQFIKELEVKHVFTLPGGGCIHLIDSLGKSDLEPVFMLHEQAAAIAADGYSQYTDNIGVALVTTGPGCTNAITGVAASWADSIPLLVISGQVNTYDMIGNKKLRQSGFQELDTISLVSPITKYAATVKEPGAIDYYLKRAISEATKDRPGPVWLEIPLDVQAAEVGDPRIDFSFPKSPPYIKSRDQLFPLEQEILNRLVEAKKPVVLVGNGLRRRTSSASTLVEQLGHLYQVPIMLTWKAADLLPEGYEWLAGRPGTIAQKRANVMLDEADFVLTVGARLDPGQIGYNLENFAPNALKAAVDIDSAELNKLYNFSLKLKYDASEFIMTLLENKPKINRPLEWKLRLEELENIHLNYPKSNYKYNTYRFFEELSDSLKEEDIIVPGSSGTCSEVLMQTLQVKRGQRVFNSQGLGSMGFGIPAAIGAACASNKRVVCIDGDGSFAMNLQSLEVIRRLKLDIIIYVLNNRGYLTIKNTQKKHFEENYVGCNSKSGLTLPKISKLAHAFGLPCDLVTAPTRQDVLKTLNKKGPRIAEVFLDDTHETKWRVKVKKENGQFIAGGMSDLTE